MMPLEVGGVFECTLLDRQIPSANGLGLLQQLKSEFHLSRIKMMVMSSNAVTGKLSDAIERGPADSVVKPTKLTVFENKVEAL